MNKGIEILLERRKTHPEEFMGRLDKFERSRWNRFLRNCAVDLDQPNTYPVGSEGEYFTKEVMNRLLTQSDLRPESILTAAAITEQSLKILEDNLKFSHYANIQDEFK